MQKTLIATLMIAVMSGSAYAKIGSGSKSSGTRFALKRESTVTKITSRNYEKPSLPTRQAAAPTTITPRGGFTLNTQKNTDTIASPPETISKTPSRSSYGNTSTYKRPSSGIDGGDAAIIALQAAQLALEMKRHNDSDKAPAIIDETPVNMPDPQKIIKESTKNKDAQLNSASSPMGGFFKMLLWLMVLIPAILLLIVVFNMVRREKRVLTTHTPITPPTQPMEFKTMDPTIQRQQTVRTQEEEDILRQKGPSFYKEFQEAVENNNDAFVQAHTTLEMYDEVRQAMNGAQDKTKIEKIDVEDVYDIRFQQGVFYASIHFTGYFSYVNQPDQHEIIDEVWHVVRDDTNTWKVAGLDTLA